MSSGAYNLFEILFPSPVAHNIFLAKSLALRTAYVYDMYRQCGDNYEVLRQLSQKIYAPHFLVVITDRDNFMRLTDFTNYNEALTNTTFYELEEIARTNDHDEKFMKFLRYVQMLDETDSKKSEGQKFVNLVYNLDKFKAYQNVSLQIFENESIIQEEEGLEEGAHKVHAESIAPNSQKVPIKNIRMDDFYDYVINGNEQAAIDFLKTYNLTDFLFFRGPSGRSATIDLLQENRRDFINSYVSLQDFTLLQLAARFNCFNLVKYILSEHKILNVQRELRTIDPRIILVNHFDNDDETLTLRLAGGNADMFSYLWENFS
jgi:hypothetical protein